MIDPKEFSQALEACGVVQAVGVPDSVLKSVLLSLEQNFGSRFDVVANEGSAVAHAIGTYVASGGLSLVFMQNSGLGNAVNPLVSLAHRDVFGCPMVLLVGWRGEILKGGKQIKDEPQHLLQGRITKQLLELLEIPLFELRSDRPLRKQILEITRTALEVSGPVAVLAGNQTFLSSASTQEKKGLNHGITREEGIKAVVDACPPTTTFVAATGMIGRELSEILESRIANGQAGLLVVGGMGHASSIAAGVGAAEAVGKVVCLDGDGGLLMHMGSLPHTAQTPALVHVLLNNGVHDSVGGQATVAREITLKDIVSGAGYGSYFRCVTGSEISEAIGKSITSMSSAFIEIVCRPGHRLNLGRPATSPSENFSAVASHLRELAAG